MSHFERWPRWAPQSLVKVYTELRNEPADEWKLSKDYLFSLGENETPPAELLRGVGSRAKTLNILRVLVRQPAHARCVG